MKHPSISAKHSPSPLVLPAVVGPAAPGGDRFGVGQPPFPHPRPAPGEKEKGEKDDMGLGLADREPIRQNVVDENKHPSHHVINRGNYRQDLFINEGAHASFEKCLFEPCAKCGCLNVMIGGSDRDIYELQATVSPTALASATSYWFSAVANTPDDTDNFYWAAGNAGSFSARAWRINSGTWDPLTNGDFYYELNSEPIHEPTTISFLA